MNLYELDIEAYDLEQCLEPDVRTTPSPCTTPSSMTEPATTTSTNPTTSTTETITTETPTTTISTTISTTAITTNLETTDPADTTDPLTSTDPTNINNLDKIRMNNATSEEVKEHTLYGGLCLLGVTVIVQFLVIVLLAVKLCQRKRREKVVVEEGEAVSDRQQELRKINRQNSDRDNETVISNRSSIDMETTADSSIPKTEI